MAIIIILEMAIIKRIQITDYNAFGRLYYSSDYMYLNFGQTIIYQSI
jgi:hypothetical protein